MSESGLFDGPAVGAEQIHLAWGSGEHVGMVAIRVGDQLGVLTADEATLFALALVKCAREAQGPTP